MPPIQDLIPFLILAVVAIGSALGMIFSRNTIYSALNLIINLGTVAVFYLLLGAPFLAMAQVTVYAGAIMVLFLFVIMLLGIDQRKEGNELPWQRPVAITLGVILILEAGYVFITRSGVMPAMTQVADNFGSPTLVGELLFSQYLLPFEITSVLLLVAMVGAIVLTRHHNIKM